MKKLGLSLFILVIMLTSCDELYKAGKIEQEVTSINRDYHLRTVVNYDGKQVLYHLDEIDINKPDEVEVIKTKRYKEAIALIDKLEVIDEIKVSKKL